MWRLLIALCAVSIVLSACTTRGSLPPIAEGGSAKPSVLQGGGQPVTWTRFSPNTYTTQYGGIVEGPDKNMWFVDVAGNGVVRMSMDGSATEFPLPTLGARPVNIAATKTSIYVLACSNQGVYVVSPKGKVKEDFFTPFQVNCSADSGRQTGFTTDANGNAWIVGEANLVKMTPAGVFTLYPYPDGSTDNFSGGGITPGPDGRIWFIEPSPRTIDAIDPSSGIITQYAVDPNCGPYGGIVSARDGNLWFVCGAEAMYGKITTSGSSTLYSNPGVSRDPLGAIAGPGGDPWFIDPYPFGSNTAILRTNTADGSAKAFTSNYADTAVALTSASDGNIWLTTSDGRIAVFIRNVLKVTPASLNFASPQLSATITATEKGHPTLTASSSNVGIATVAPTSSNTFDVQSQAVGYCTITVQDAIGNSFEVPVVVQ